MAATNPGDGSRAHRPYLESRSTPFVSRPSSQGLEPVSRLRGTAPQRYPVRIWTPNSLAMRREEHEWHRRKVARIQCVRERLLRSNKVPVRSLKVRLQPCSLQR